jgi:hypothetical protein
MKRIIVDFEGGGEVMTAYECPVCQTIANLAYQTVTELIQEGFPVFHTIEEIIETPGKQLSIPVSEKVAKWLRLRRGQKVETFVADEKHILIALS